MSAWIDVYDYDDTKTSIAQAVALIDRAAASGATTVWIEPSRYKTAPIWAPRALGAMLDRAAVRKMPVVLWTLPGFINVTADVNHALAAERFRGPRGGRASAIALDIEVPENAPPAVRSVRLVAVSRILKVRLKVPLIAIVPSPVGMARHPKYWPGFPWRALARDVVGVAVMGYWSFPGKAPVPYTRDVLVSLRAAVGPGVPLHVIGGLAEDTSPAQVRDFCTTVRRYGGIGAGLYDLTSMRAGTGSAAFAGCRSLGRR